MSIILRVDGLLGNMTGTVYGEQVNNFGNSNLRGIEVRQQHFDGAIALRNDALQFAVVDNQDGSDTEITHDF
jgi:hypothetical protein